MYFHKLAPPGDLRGYVRYFWTLESSSEASLPSAFTTLADGCPGLIVQRAGDSPFCDGTGKAWPRSFLYGQTTRANHISTSGPFQTLGICFEPSALTAVFGLNAAELTDACLDLPLLAAPQAGNLAEQLAAISAVPECVDHLAAFLRAGTARHRTQVDSRVRQSLAQLLESGGRVSLPDLQRAVGLSERSLQRKFKHSVGISPQLFARICRFQASLAQLRTRQYGKFSDLAFELEYADQSHHIRAFREFAGASPQQVRQRAQPGVPEFPELLR
ncbi:DUF6597 domain-containing transcriptional factor [uncultured Hymenobacter sp.]|uniref:DUF6597 domain-containing transcriptional factor n=1 Tax=uncultured Hymenobacter sp. TaxID=170016 RepID=UPI0035C9F487